MPSLDLLLQVAVQERNNQNAHFDALDTKAGVLLAFDGVLIALSGHGQLEFGLAAITLASASAAAALMSFLPRKYPVIEPMAFRQFLTYEAEDTRLKVHDTVASAVMRGGQVLHSKIKYLKLGVVLLLIAALSFGTGVIINTISQHPGRTQHVIQRATQKPAPKPTKAGSSASPTP